MKIPAGGRQAAEQRRKIDQALGHQMDDRAFALHLPEDAEQAGAEQFAALLSTSARARRYWPARFRLRA
jgi:hypothetical protein